MNNVTIIMHDPQVSFLSLSFLHNLVCIWQLMLTQKSWLSVQEAGFLNAYKVYIFRDDKELQRHVSKNMIKKMLKKDDNQNQFDVLLVVAIVT